MRVRVRVRISVSVSVRVGVSVRLSVRNVSTALLIGFDKLAGNMGECEC